MPHTTIQEFTSFPNKYKPAGLILRTDEDKMYINIGTFAVPEFVLIGDPSSPATFVGTGSAINSLDAAAGQIAFCTADGNGFLANETYIRNAADTDWIIISNVFFGNASDGDSTNPATPADNRGVLQYDNLTFTSNTTWNVDSAFPLLILVRGTLTISSSIEWTINMTNPTTRSSGSGGSGTGSGASGGAGGNPNQCVIIANKIVATGTAKIIVNGQVGGAGGNGDGNASSSGAGANGNEPTFAFSGFVVSSGSGVPDSGNSGGNGQTGGTGGTAVLSSDELESFLKSASLCLIPLSVGGAGGGQGQADTTTFQLCSGGGGAEGGMTLRTSGGSGGKGGNQLGSDADGAGGGGGGGPIVFIFITNAMDADLTVQAIGGAGGVGGNGDPDETGDGGGGGGGDSLMVLIADSDIGTRTATGGAGGLAGNTNDDDAANGGSGNTATQFIDIDNFILDL